MSLFFSVVYFGLVHPTFCKLNKNSHIFCSHFLYESTTFFRFLYDLFLNKISAVHNLPLFDNKLKI